MTTWYIHVHNILRFQNVLTCAFKKLLKYNWASTTVKSVYQVKSGENTAALDS